MIGVKGEESDFLMELGRPLDRVGMCGNTVTQEKTVVKYISWSDQGVNMGLEAVQMNL